MKDEASFVEESARRRALIVAVCKPLMEQFPDVECELEVVGPAFEPVAEFAIDGVGVASVYARAGGCSMLLGPTYEVLALDDLEFDDAIEIVRVVLLAQLEAQTRDP